jgi:serine/threonine-protein kinase RsbW
MSAPRAEWTLPIDLASLAETEIELDRFFTDTGVNGTPSFVIKMVFEEVGRNLVEHADAGADDTLRVIAIAEPDLVTIVLEDSRAPFDPLSDSGLDTDSPLEERRAGGMGLHLVQQMTSSLAYERRGDRNVLTATVARG